MTKIRQIVSPPAGLVAGMRRLLIPVDATAQSRWSLRYALRQPGTGGTIVVCLLFVAETVREWEVLRFRTESEIRRHFQARGRVFLEDAATQLRDAGIEVCTYFREADPILGVLSFAEELECSEIVVPRPERLGWFSAGIAGRLVRAAKANHIPVVLVNSVGEVET